MVDELGRCWPRWLTICNLASYGHGISVSSRQFPVISTRGISMAMGCSTKKSCVRFQVGKKPAPAARFHKFWRDFLVERWFVQMTYRNGRMCNDSLRSYSLQKEYVPTHFSSFLNQWLYHRFCPIARVVCHFLFFWPCQTTWICLNAFFMDCTKA